MRKARTLSLASARHSRSPSKAVKRKNSDLLSMEEAMPEVFGQLLEVQADLERHYRDMQDIEFTVEEGRLWMLQTRSGKRTAKAAVRIAVEMAGEGLITKDEAVLRVDPASLDQLLHPMLDPTLSAPCSHGASPPPRRCIRRGRVQR